MTITNNFLNEIAKSINDESYEVSTSQAVATTIVASIYTTDTSLSGEIGARTSLSGTRTNNELEFTSLRSSTSVLDTTDGDKLKSTGLLTATSGGILLTGVVLSGITQTTNFDLEVVTSISVNRL